MKLVEKNILKKEFVWLRGELIQDVLPSNYIHITFKKDKSDTVRILNIDFPENFDIEKLLINDKK